MGVWDGWYLDGEGFTVFFLFVLAVLPRHFDPKMEFYDCCIN